MHEESWNYGSEEHYSYGSSMQMKPAGPCPPKHSKHQIMFSNGSDITEHQDMVHGQKMNQNGWHGSQGTNSQFYQTSGGKMKPASCKNETQYLENSMYHNASMDDEIVLNNGSNAMHRQDMLQGQKMHKTQKMHQNGCYGSSGMNGQFSHASGGKKKPVSCMNETQFLENSMCHNASMDAEFSTGAFAMVHTPANAMRVEETRYGYSNWGGTDAGQCQSYESNFNWSLSGCTNY